MERASIQSFSSPNKYFLYFFVPGTLLSTGGHSGEKGKEGSCPHGDFLPRNADNNNNNKNKNKQTINAREVTSSGWKRVTEEGLLRKRGQKNLLQALDILTKILRIRCLAWWKAEAEHFRQREQQVSRQERACYDQGKKEAYVAIAI